MISGELLIVLLILLFGECAIAIILYIVHIKKVKEIRELRKEVEACKNSFGGYLSLLDKENLRLHTELEKKNTTRTASPRK